MNAQGALTNTRARKSPSTRCNDLRRLRIRDPLHRYLVLSTDAVQARLLFPVYRAFGIAHDRNAFARGYRIFIRGLGVIMIALILIGLSLP